jgi:hypothetical protein
MWFFIILIIFAIIYYINSQSSGSSNKPSKASAPSSTSTKKHLSSLTQFNSHIAGIPHRFGSDVDLNLIVKSRSALTVQREPDNPHDKNAIRLYSGKVFVGFVPKVDNPIIAKHIDTGGSVDIIVTSVDPSDKWHGAKICIKLI